MLPIHAVLGPLRAALAAGNTAVLAAPPGAGKTTVVPLALLEEPWLDSGKLLVLEPRRLAARAAAERMAATLGEQTGDTVGYRTRLQSRIGPRTRIEVITEGVFTRMILDDPGLEGVGAVLFDEFHERSLDADLGLALARETQGLLREDLRLLVMSATLDIGGVSRLLDGAPVIEAEGRMFPVETRHLDRNPVERIEDAAARAVMQALGEETGSVLVFLPGQGEIHRTAQRLLDRLRDPTVDVVPLYGALDRETQDRAIEPAPTGRRKVVLATSVAETSLTIEGVRVVIDGGLSRVPRFEPSSGLTRLATVRVSRSSAEQRRGRAGRTEPGVCYRLWDEAATRGLVPHQRPEILEADLTGFALDLARWGARSTGSLALLDQPPAGAFAEARKVLARLGALDEAGALTAHGRRMTRIPLPPRLAHMVAVASDAGDAALGARIAAVLSEPGLGGNDVDLRDRLRGLDRDRSPRAREAVKLAERWARTAGGGQNSDVGGEADVGALLAEAFPERVAKARGKPGEVLLASGRGAFLDPTDGLAREPWPAEAAEAAVALVQLILLVVTQVLVVAVLVVTNRDMAVSAVFLLSIQIIFLMLFLNLTTTLVMDMQMQLLPRIEVIGLLVVAAVEQVDYTLLLQKPQFFLVFLILVLLLVRVVLVYLKVEHLLLQQVMDMHRLSGKLSLDMKVAQKVFL